MIKSVPIVRPDGKRIKVVPKMGHLFTCQHGCCCGRTDRGFAPGFQDLFHQEWERRKLRNQVHLTHTACLGPCSLANVALVIFDGQSIWFHSLNNEERVLRLYDYIERMVGANSYLAPSADLAEYVFPGFIQQEKQLLKSAQF